MNVSRVKDGKLWAYSRYFVIFWLEERLVYGQWSWLDVICSPTLRPWGMAIRKKNANQA
ncbi:hypothetical protein [Vibrio sp. LaRot3]|uniref:hypothetical protein n=1 Tax=Vibrio sp. LaRot3 TaxID=2998829 RepID=UPI0022CDE709|nr:hypothetical protein [Vibrio sp. LaRot3]MDA0148982.1 hypothetical protein [Vibrio sp. LaRot3]